MTTNLAVGSLIISLFALYVSYQSWRTSDDKLKLDLYNRRFDIYVSALELYQSVTTSKEDWVNAAETMGRFIKYQRESQFLFRKEDGVYETLNKVRLECNAMLQYQRELAKPEDERDRDMLKIYQKMQVNSMVSG